MPHPQEISLEEAKNLKKELEASIRSPYIKIPHVFKKLYALEVQIKRLSK